MARGADQHQNPQSDIEIAQAATMRPIGEIAAKLGIPDAALSPYGRFKAKVGLDYVDSLKSRPNGKLILVTAITPTPAGEGKTTTTVGLGDALNHIGKKAIICLREPSLGPSFGQKGGAAGGGYAQVVPMEDINLHFTGDFHAIGAANNLLAAMVDNHIYWGNELGIDSRRVTWRRGLDMNDRALRQITSSLGGVANGFPREDGFDIVVASEVMAIFCLSNDLHDLQRRLANIIVGQTRAREPVRAGDIKAAGAMALLLLKDADRAQPGADAGEQPGLYPWRPVRQHRAWLQLGDRHQDGAEARRIRRHRGRFRGRSRRRKVHGHQMPQGRTRARCGGYHRYRARLEDAWRCRSRSAPRRKRRGARGGLCEPRAASREFAGVWYSGGGIGQPVQRRHRRRACQAQRAVPPRTEPERSSPTIGRMAARAPRRSRRRWSS